MVNNLPDDVAAAMSRYSRRRKAPQEIYTRAAQQTDADLVADYFIAQHEAQQRREAEERMPADTGWLHSVGFVTAGRISDGTDWLVLGCDGSELYVSCDGRMRVQFGGKEILLTVTRGDVIAAAKLLGRELP